MNQAALALILVVSLLVFNLTEQMDKRDKQISYDGAQATFTQLALAQYRRSTTFISASNPILGLEGYASTPAKLVDDGYLSFWEDDYSYWTFDISSGLTIRYNAGSTYAARQIARRLGNISSVSGTTVSVGFADAAELSMLNAFVKRQGDSMQGLLSFDAGMGTALQLNNNNIAGVGAITASQVNSTDVTSTTGRIDTLTSKTITDVENLDADNISGVRTIKVKNGVGRVESKSVVTDTVLTGGLVYTN